MIPVETKYGRLVLVCTNGRDDGRECCMAKGSVELHTKLKEAIKAVSADVRVVKTGCLNACSTGATVVVMPENVWFGQVTEEDIPEIVAHATRD
ncbi:MAG: (2Fe-2S) ferredoxin domain-containing protein [Candidatus Uhrbacteria bacterium]